jgi:hypothetical protein
VTACSAVVAGQGILLLILAAILLRASSEKAVATDRGLLIRNVWRTHKLAWVDIDRFRTDLVRSRLDPMGRWMIVAVDRIGNDVPIGASKSGADTELTTHLAALRSWANYMRAAHPGGESGS